MSAQMEKPKPGLAVVIVVPLLIWILSGIAAVVLLVMGAASASNTYDDFARFPADTPTDIELTEAGGYRIWLVRDTYGTYDAYATATVTGPDDQDIPTSDYVGGLDFNDGTAVLTFNIDEPGVYTIEASPSDDLPAEFRVGKGNPFSEAGRGVLLFFLVGSIGFAVALILFIVLMVRRSRSRKRINQAYGGGFGGGYGGGYPPAGGYPQPGGYPESGGYPQPGGYPGSGGYPQPGGDGGYSQPGGYPESGGHLPPGGDGGYPQPPGGSWS